MRLSSSFVAAAMPAFSRQLWLPVVLACLCCACSTPEERADAAFGELTAVVEQIRAELAGITDAETSRLALPALTEHAEALRDTLSCIDELAEDPALPQDARRRVSEQYHEPLRAAVDAALREGQRLARRALYHSDGLNRLLRRELAHYNTKGVHPWPYAVLAGRECRPKPPHK